MKNTSALLHKLTATFAAATALALSGCSGGFQQAMNQPVTLAGTALHGKVHGGQQPVASASLYLYAASTSGYSAANANLLRSSVLTDAGGNFNITNDYTCTAGQQMYLVVVGGNSGGGTNANIALMAALGDCANLSASTNILMNEVTTIASVYALAPFMSDYTHIGSSATNKQGLARAFNNVNKLVSNSTGSAGGPALAANASLPLEEINTLANILAACINTGGVSGNSAGACATLFADMTPSGGTAPSDTIGLALALARNPALNVDKVFPYALPTSPFMPQLSRAPADWTVTISYNTGALSTPATTTVDTQGNIWVADPATNTVAVLTQTGAPASGSPFSGNGLNAPSSIAIDSAGNGWIANGSGTTVSVFTASGSVVGGSPFSGGGAISAPTSIAIDAPGNIWIGNRASKTVTELSNSGGLLYQSPVQTGTPGSVAINPR
jgi:hypothetical protein